MAVNEDTMNPAAVPAPVVVTKIIRRRRFSSPRFRVDIDQDTINASVRRDSSHCMIAEAIQRLRPGSMNVQVDLHQIVFTDPKKRLRYHYLTPREAQVALIKFDRGEAPEPFSFVLAAAPKVTRGRAPAAVLKDRRAGEAPDGSSAKKLRERNRRDEIHRRQPDLALGDGYAPVAVTDAAIAASEDPYADLGPVVAVPHVGVRTPTMLGGRARSEGNLSRVRRFGIRQYRE